MGAGVGPGIVLMVWVLVILRICENCPNEVWDCTTMIVGKATFSS